MRVLRGELPEKLGRLKHRTGRHARDRDSGYRRFTKRLGHRLMRRWGKTLLDNAPRRLPHSGWTY